MPPPYHPLLLGRDEHTPVEEHKSGGVPGWAIFLIVLVVIGLIAAAAFAVYKLTLGRSPLSNPRSGGIGGGIGDSARSWMSNVVYKVKNPRARSSTAGYEPSGISAGRARGGTGRGALDPDEAWDARVGHEAEYGNPFYEETELQNQGTTHYSGAGYGGATAYHGQSGGLGSNLGAETERGRSPSKERGLARENPFSDDAAASLRSVSPRPVIDTGAAADLGKQTGGGSHQSSPTERRSMFHENV